MAPSAQKLARGSKESFHSRIELTLVTLAPGGRLGMPTLHTQVSHADKE